MKKDLLSIAMGLSDKEIMQLSRLKKDGGKKLAALRRERKKLAVALARIDGRIAALGGSSDAADAVDAAPRRKRRVKKQVSEKKPATARKPAGMKKIGVRRAKGGKIGLTESVRQALARADSPMRASEIVEALPQLGYKVKDTAATRKRVSIVLATQKKNFVQAARGLYRIVE